jgi:hypothetical protein
MLDVRERRWHKAASLVSKAAMRRLAPLLLTLAAAPIAAQTMPSISIDTLKSVTQELSSDTYEGRAPTTPAEDKTVAYIVKRFQAAGLKPGNNGSWTQDVPMVEITGQNVRPLTFSGGRTPLSFAYRSDMVAATYRVTPTVSVQGSPVVFVGYGINAPEKGWNDYAGVDVHGKTVVILVNDPDWQMMTRQGPFEGRAMTYYGRWTYKFEEAARQGAAAAIIVHQTEPAAYPWAVVQSSWTGPQLELDQPGDHADQSQMIDSRRQAQGLSCGAAGADHVGGLHQHDPAAGVEERDRRAAGHRCSRRLRSLLGALGPSRPLRRGQRGRHLQRRARQCHGRRGAGGARGGARPGRAGQAVHGVPGGDG